MALCVSCDRLFCSEQALQQHQQDSPTHTRTIRCVLCDRSFGSEQALKQHQEYSLVHTGTFCKPCNRNFGSKNALKQHQHDSPLHSSEGTSSAGRSTGDLGSSLLPCNARAPRRERNNERTSRTPPGITPDLISSRYRPSLMPGNFPHRETLIKPTQPSTAHLPRRKEETRTSFVFPELHDKIAKAVLPEVSSPWFQNDDRKGYNNEHLTCVVGTFVCDNQTCKKQSWASGVVSILMRGYSQNGYSAVVFNQRCKACEKLGTFTMDETIYVERVAYRIKKWAGVCVQSPVYKKKSKGPHEEKLCEGCKRGACPYISESRSHLTD